MIEKEYIDREALQEIFENRMQDDNIMCPVIKVLDVMEIIENQPAVDVVEVVRCKDCYYYDSQNDYCNYFDFDPPSGAFYCRDGERKESEENK